MEGFTKREVEEAQKAREAQSMLGHPTDRDFLGMVRGGMISNCPVTVNAVKNAHQILGPDLTGNFPFMSIDGSVCFFVLYHYETNTILVKPIANVDNSSKNSNNNNRNNNNFVDLIYS